MIVLDGGFGEGGGQILRTAVALSALSSKEVRIVDIRARRDNPGLRPQHVTSVNSVAELCDAEVEGNTIGSSELTFRPGTIKSGSFKFNVGTAGSATLVLQALLPAAIKAENNVTIEIAGGTDVKWSPSVDYLKHVFCYYMKRIGCEISVDALSRGFYPAGGGVLKAQVKPSEGMGRLRLTDAGVFENIDVWSVATNHLRDREVAERQVKGFLRDITPNYSVGKINRVYVDSQSVGSSFHAHAQFTSARKGVCAIGEKSLKAEDVGRKAALELISELNSKSPFDIHMSDQILPYLALFGGEIRVPQLSNHAQTNIHVINQFGFGIKVDGDLVRT
ncbi:MAG: RNA 3'-terminal phosphate cyclase [Candidatus Altiarchaeota archaeon]